jgi:acetyl-CoA acyltransferase
MLEKVVIIDALRTPLAKSKSGAYRYQRAEALTAHVMSALIERTPSFPVESIGDIYWGCAQQHAEQSFNLARNAALLAGLPDSIPAVTVNRLCGSSMQALHDAARAIMVGDSQACLVGGTEHMEHIPMQSPDIHPQLGQSIALSSSKMGMTAEWLAEHYDITRQKQDEFALRSHQYAHLAQVVGGFSEEIIPTPSVDENGAVTLLKDDEIIRADCNKDDLESLSSVFISSGSVTAGNASAISSGASGILITSERFAHEHHLPIRAYIESMAVSGCSPANMGLGPVEASQIALNKASLTIDEIEAIEINEAFAVQTIACIEQMKINNWQEKVNLHGGAIALGHPLGCSGSRIVTTLLNVMEKSNKSLGLATMCIGMGQGIATVVKRA